MKCRTITSLQALTQFDAGKCKIYKIIFRDSKQTKTMITTHEQGHLVEIIDTRRPDLLLLSMGEIGTARFCIFLSLYDNNFNYFF